MTVAPGTTADRGALKRFSPGPKLFSPSKPNVKLARFGFPSWTRPDLSVYRIIFFNVRPTKTRKIAWPSFVSKLVGSDVNARIGEILVFGL